jgi:hypothetical protein
MRLRDAVSYACAGTFWKGWLQTIGRVIGHEKAASRRLVFTDRIPCGFTGR